MYLVRKNIVDDKEDGYWVDEKINGKLVESYYVTLKPNTCSCQHFTNSNNAFNHFHINLVYNWLKHGCPECAIYSKTKEGKIQTLCPGFIKKSSSKIQ